MPERRALIMQTGAKRAVEAAPIGDAPAGLSPYREWLLVAAVLATALLTYLPTLRYAWVFDDPVLIVNNPRIESARFLPGYFTQQMWAHVSAQAESNYYHPLLLTWYLLQFAIFGLRPWAWHLVVVLQHLAVTALLYFLVRRLLGRAGPAAIAAMIFAVHPVHVEAVAWVAGGSESFYSIFFLASLLAYLAWNDTRRSRWIVAAVFLYFLAALSKEEAVVLPAVIFAHECAYRDRSTGVMRGLRSAILHTAWFVPAGLAYFALRLRAIQAVTHPVASLSSTTIVLTCPSVAWEYLKHLLWPVGLAAYYDVPYVSAFSAEQVLLPAVVLIVVAGGIWRRARNSPDVTFAALWPVISLLPFFDLPALPLNEIVKDRYLYLPCAGFAILAAIALEKLGKERALCGLSSRTVFATTAIVAAFCFASAYYSLFWSNDLALNARAVSIAPHSVTARNNLANELLERGRLDEARAQYVEVLRQDPGYWLSIYNLGYLEYRAGRYTDAVRDFLAALQRNPNDSDTYLYLGLSQFKSGTAGGAEAALKRAIELNPEHQGYHFALGFVYEERGDCEAARAEYKQELRFHPDNGIARRQLSVACVGKN